MVKVGLGRGLMYLWFTLNHTRPVTSKKARQISLLFSQGEAHKGLPH